jgi:ketosteroid isomerase-like protein
MAEIMISNLDAEGERRPFAAHGHAVLGNAGGAAVLRGSFEPGWRWSEDVAPLAGTTSCRVHHLGYVLSGSMRVRLDDGSERDVSAGDLFDLPEGHDAWVTSDVPCEMVDFSPEATRYAVGRPKDIAGPEDAAMKLVRLGYEAFNAHDVEGLRSLFAHDVAQHVPGTGPLAGTYKGVDAVLGYYGRLGELTDGTFRADLVDVHGDGHGHVLAVQQMSSVRNGVKHVSRGSIVFTFLGDKVTDLLELHGDLPGDDAFLS